MNRVLPVFIAFLIGHVLLGVPASYAQTTVAPTQAPAATPAPKPAAATAATKPPAGAPVPSPAAPLPPKAGEIASDPIRCWWKADRTAVRVGERFGLVLTCAVIKTGPITVEPVLN